jgi:hypothetical protein
MEFHVPAHHLLALRELRFDRLPITFSECIIDEMNAAPSNGSAVLDIEPTEVVASQEGVDDSHVDEN